MENWASSIWFTVARLQELHWARPWVLYFLPLVPLLFLLKYFLQNQSKVSLPLATIGQNFAKNWTAYLRILPSIFMFCTLALLFVALARPTIQISSQRRISEGIDIVFAVDISESMTYKDLAPNRLEAAKKFINGFINGRFQDRIGIVVFSGGAYTLAPLTTDYQTLSAYISEINYNAKATEGTAIGSAIAVGVNRLNMAQSKTKVLILVSDGDNTAGSIDPQTSAKLAAVYGVKIYSIFVGKQENNAQGFEKSVDQNQLRTISKLTNGQYFAASNSEQLNKIFDQINKLEKVKYLESRSDVMIDVYYVYLRWAIVLLLLVLFTKITFIGNILAD